MTRGVGVCRRWPVLLRWTDANEAIAFISAALGAPFISADTSRLLWGAFATPDRETGERDYTVTLELADGGKVASIHITFMAVAPADTSAMLRLYAIIGWAHAHSIAVTTD